MENIDNKDKETEQEGQEAINNQDNSSNVNDNIESNAEDLSVKLAEMQDKYLRLSAEFDNYRKRTLKEKYDLIRTASEDVIKDLLPVLDDFDRALEALEKSSGSDALLEGVKLIHEKFSNVLKQKGLCEIEAIGKDFDPDVYEAVAKCPAPEDSLKGKVIDLAQKGYMINEKVIRYPKVIVAE